MMDPDVPDPYPAPEIWIIEGYSPTSDFVVIELARTENYAKKKVRKYRFNRYDRKWTIRRFVPAEECK